MAAMEFPKIQLNPQQRELYAQRVTEVGNLAVAALLIGQVITAEFRLDWTLWGIGIWVASYITGGIIKAQGQEGAVDEQCHIVIDPVVRYDRWLGGRGLRSGLT